MITGLLARDDEVVEIVELPLRCRYFNDKWTRNSAVLELELDDQPFDAFPEVVEPLAVHTRRREKRVALLVENWQILIDR